MIKNILTLSAAAALSLTVLSSCGSNVKLAEVSEEIPAYTQTGEINRSAAPDWDDETVMTSDEAATEPDSEVLTEPFSLDVSVPENYSIPQTYVLDSFEAVLQNPELPTGCEVTSLTATLNYLGFDVDKITLADEFMPIDFQGAVVMDEAYVGDPRLDGFGCNANVIVQTADKYFASVDSPCYAEELTGSSLNELFWQLSQGRPVIVWSTIGLKITTPELVWTAGNGKDFIFNWYQHCMTIYGYDLDQGIVYAADPLEGNTTYPLDLFEEAYDLMGDQAVVICGDASTEGHHVTTEAEKSVTMHTLKEYNEEKAAAEEGAESSAEE